MFKNRLFMLLLIVTLLIPTVAIHAQDGEGEPACEGLLFLNAWSRPSPANVANGAMYFVVVNLGEEDDTLIGGTTEFADVLEIHEMFMLDDGSMRMQPVAGGLVIPAGGFAELRPGGYHVMLIGVTKDMLEGEMVDASLEFEKAGIVDVSGLIGFDPPMEPTALATGNISGCSALDLYGGYTYPNTEHAGVYGLLVNLSEEEMVITGVSTDAAETAHFVAPPPAEGMDGGMDMGNGESGSMDGMDMDGEHDAHANFQMLERLSIPPMGFVILKSDGVHLALDGLTNELMAGDTFDLTFSLESGDDLTVSVDVHEAMMSMDMDMGDHDGMDMDGMDMDGMDHDMDSTPEAEDAAN